MNTVVVRSYTKSFNGCFEANCNFLLTMNGWIMYLAATCNTALIIWKYSEDNIKPDIKF